MQYVERINRLCFASDTLPQGYAEYPSHLWFLPPDALLQLLLASRLCLGVYVDNFMPLQAWNHAVDYLNPVRKNT